MNDEQQLIENLYAQIHAARRAATELARAETEQKNAVLHSLSALIASAEQEIIAANRQDIAMARNNDYPESMINRLQIDSTGIKALSQSLIKIAELPDPVGAVMDAWQEPNGLDIQRIRTPIGVIGVIYESRPNVTIDAGALCFKSGNAVILRGGKDALNSNRLLCALFQQALSAEGFDPSLVQLVQSPNRVLVGVLLKAQGLIDVIIPRGGKSLVERVMNEARVPVFAHLEGIVHVYVHQSAKPEMVQSIVLNAKMRRTSVCGAAECLLIDKDFSLESFQPTIDALIAAGCTIRGDEKSCAWDSRIIPAQEDDWGREYLAPIIAMKIVENQQEAETHIAQYSSGHTEVILAESAAAAEQFLQHVDSAIVMHNASSQFADGGEFGMGAEIGISTSRMHARGPVGLEQLTTFHYTVRGNGAVRP